MRKLAFILTATLLLAAACNSKPSVSTNSVTNSHNQLPIADNATPSQTQGNASTKTSSTKPSPTPTPTPAPNPTPPPVSGSTVDLTKLRLGDSLTTTTTPQRNYVYECAVQSGGGGSQVNGPWIHGSTWDYTSKIWVMGSVSWNSATHSISLGSSQRVITSNGLPNHTTGIYPIQSSDPAYQYDRNPSSLTTQNVSFSIPANPSFSGHDTCVGGEVGVALNGIPIYNALDGENRDALAHEEQDHCQGHPNEHGYHYHNGSTCLLTEFGQSALIGYAFDGFGIYGPVENGQELTNADLDECHGRTSSIVWDGKTVTMYHYVATKEFPYTVGCFKGTPIQTGPGGPPPR